MAFSPREALAGATVLLTGGLGFLGSVCLEQLLRLTEVEKVYLLVRGKKHLTAAQRVENMLCLPLFHLLHDDARSGKRNVFTKVQAVEGDLALPGLGLSAEDAAAVRNEVTVIIHCAADIELDAPIQKTLKANYLGTRAVLELAAECQKLRVFLHTSTYFVNSHLPRHALVNEKIYRLPLDLPKAGMTDAEYSAAADAGKLATTHAEFVTAMLERPAEEADQDILLVMNRLNFASSYAFGKYLTELSVEEYPLPGRVSKVFVRPSLICSLAGAPYPGYVAGYGGPAGYTMGYAAGFFSHITSVAYGSDYIMDLIPADVVAALVLAAAAAGLVSSSSGTPALAIYHAASAESHPCPLKLVFDIMGKFWEKNPPPLRLPLTWYPTFKSIDERLEPSAVYMTIGRRVTLTKIWGVSRVLSALGKSREARLLSNAYKAFGVYNSRRYDRSITCAVDNARALQGQMAPEERQLLPMVWEESIMSWENYGNIMGSGIRKLLFRTKEDSVVPDFVTPKFRTWPAAEANVLRLPAHDTADTAVSDGSDGSDGVDAIAYSKVDQKQPDGVVKLTAKAM
eukprot:GHUV01001568.1.p1 GENE.GHUV01001568.1~~GHUV01001568.1.p1  ORF type:complete len:569 (+),score=137.92 GHUV01001568.1:356-2062(+)